jgi:5-(carboxyamino)imidazole ribonucleotide synthase
MYTTLRIGILGGGQLGRMLAQAAYHLGAQCLVWDPAADPCAAQLCDHIRGDFHDLQALQHLTQAVDVITYEFENVPLTTAQWLAQRRPVYPPPQALAVGQERLAEKQFFTRLGIPTPAFHAVDNESDFRAAVRDLGLPAVLKTRRFGYDGKGQALLRTSEDCQRAWQQLGGQPLLLEQYIPFDRELSILAVRSHTGDIRTWPLVENQHIDGILHRSLAPASAAEELQERAADYACRILEELDYVGVLAVEWFQDGPRLLANEMAPRVHNSGHWTIEAAHTSQFENHIRAIAGWPLGPCHMLTNYAVMYNFIGSIPPLTDILQVPEAHVHIYGKDPFPGRKVGHVTLLATSDREFADKLPLWDQKFARSAFINS